MHKSKRHLRKKGLERAIHQLLGSGPDPMRFHGHQGCGQRKTDFLIEDCIKAKAWRGRDCRERPLCMHYADMTPEIQSTAEVVSSNPETARLITYGFFELTRRAYKLKDWKPKDKKAFKEWQNAGSSWHFRCGNKNVILNFQGVVTEHKVVVEPKRRLKGLKK